MKWLVLLLAGCSPPKEPPFYYLSESIERDGVTVTRAYSGPTLPDRPLFDVDFHPVEPKDH